MATLKEILQGVQQGGQDFNKSLFQGMADFPILGGFSRLLRYPMEASRQVSYLPRTLMANAQGDEEKLAQLLQEASQPQYVSQSEFDKFQGTPTQAAVEGTKVGSEVASVLPWAQGLKSVPGLASILEKGVGRIGVGAAGGALQGAAGGFAGSQQGSELKDTLSGGAIGGAIGGALQGIGELGNELNKVGARTRASAVGLTKPGDTTDDMIQRLAGTKEELGRVPSTAQGVIDDASKKLQPYGQAKLDALRNLNVSSDDIATNALGEFESLLKKSARPVSTEGSKAYNDVIESMTRLSQGGTAESFDDLAIQLRNKINYGATDPISSVNKEVYDAAADAIVETLKKASPSYRVAKEGLQSVLSKINLKEVVKTASSDLKGISLPLTLGMESPIQRSSLSGLMSLAGAGEQGLGKLMGLGGNDIIQQLAGIGSGEIASMSGQPTQQNQQMQQPGTPGQYGEARLMPAPWEQQQPGQQGGAPSQNSGMSEDAQAISQILAVGVLSGDISGSEAEAVLKLLGLEQKDTAEAKTLPASSLMDLSGTQEALALLPELTGLLDEGQSAFGPIEGPIRGMIPWDQTGQTAKSTIQLVKQIIGKGLEGGVLRKEDEDKYSNILPKLGDTEANVRTKIALLEKTLKNKYATQVETFQSGGYDPFAGTSNVINSSIGL